MKRVASRIYKEYLKISKKKINNPIKTRQKAYISIWKKKHM
jgi:hypothetical protein